MSFEQKNKLNFLAGHFKLLQKLFNDSKADNITNMNSFEWSIYRIMDQSIWTEAI